MIDMPTHKDAYGNAFRGFELEYEFDRFLDEYYPTFTIGNVELYPSAILAGTDPVAYREAFLNWLDYKGYEEI